MAEDPNPAQDASNSTQGGFQIDASKLIDSIENAKPATQEQLAEVKKDLSTYEKATLRWTRTTAGIGFVTACFICLQWYVMRGQLREMHDSGIDTHDLAVAAGKQADLTRQQLIGTQAAVMQFGMTFDNVGELTVGLSNVGHVIATNVKLKITASQGRFPSGTPTGIPLTFSPTVPPLDPGRPFNRTWLLPWRPTEIGNGFGWPEEWPGKATYILRAEVSYENGFGNTVTQSVCQNWLPRFMINYKQQTSGGGGLIPCDDLQTAIKSALEQEKRAKAGADKPN